MVLKITKWIPKTNNIRETGIKVINKIIKQLSDKWKECLKLKPEAAL
jgi:hypothetical protein